MNPITEMMSPFGTKMMTNMFQISEAPAKGRRFCFAAAIQGSDLMVDVTSPTLLRQGL